MFSLLFPRKEKAVRYVKTILLTVLALTLIGSSAMAQRTPGSYSIGAFGGVCMPQGPKEFKDTYKSGFGFGGEFKYNVGPKMSFVGSYTMLSFPVDVKDSDAKFKSNIIQANALYYLMSPEAATQLTLIGGGGYYMQKFDWGSEDADNDKNSENDFGVQFGAGMDLPLGVMNLFFEGKYHIVFTEDESTKFITVMAGLRFPM
jgi:hypothetical protein